MVTPLAYISPLALLYHLQFLLAKAGVMITGEVERGVTDLGGGERCLIWAFDFTFRPC